MLNIEKCKIHIIKNQIVILDFDLVETNDVTLSTINKIIINNRETFPADFIFRLQQREWRELVITYEQLPINIRYRYNAPLAFTQKGIAMLANLL